jgi:CDGSH-type Zn-finger protein
MAFALPPSLGATIGIRRDGLLRGGTRPVTMYQRRNRVTLRHGRQSNNKPFCDGAHAAIKFRDD